MTSEITKIAEDFGRSLEILDEMEAAGLSPDLDQDVRDIVKIILEHGLDYENSEHGDMTVNLLESLRRLVGAAAINRETIDD